MQREKHDTFSEVALNEKENASLTLHFLALLLQSLIRNRRKRELLYWDTAQLQESSQQHFEPNEGVTCNVRQAL